MAQNYPLSKPMVGVVKLNRGFALLDVILAIVIFAVGMLALASLQTNLTRSSVDATTRTAAANIGEEILERLRSFRRVSTDPDGVVFAFADIDKSFVETLMLDENGDLSRAGLDYSVTAEVTAYDFNDDRTGVTETYPAVGGALYDFKLVELTISWNNNQSFILDEDTQLASSDMQTGSINIKEVIPSIPSLANALVAAADDGELGGVIVDYSPGERPDIVPIDLEGSKFKESTTPMPDVIRSDQLAETWFDVITYNNSETATFLRREEFLVLTCECELKAYDASVQPLSPTVWEGTEYSDDTPAIKNYGVSANNQQSFYCDTCCRDHHDPNGGSGDDVLDPTRHNSSPKWSESGGLNGDHIHYTRSKKGEMVAAKVGDTYVEACRMVRKDGFMRVAQDFRQEGLNGFAEGYLDTDAGIDEYSDYVTWAVDDFYNYNGTTGTPSYLQDMVTADSSAYSNGPVYFPGHEQSKTALPLLGIDSQQLRSRGIYLDALTTETSALVACLINEEGTYDPAADPPQDTPGEICANQGLCPARTCAGITNHLQVLPFFDVQTTWLSWWPEEPLGIPISVANEPVEDSNTHQRGFALLVESSNAPYSATEVDLNMLRGNTGLSVTDPITKAEDEGTADAHYEMFISVNGIDDPGAGFPASDIWRAEYRSGVNKVEVADTAIAEGNYTYCSRSGTVMTCATALNQPGSITITGYSKSQGQTYLPLYICVTEPNGSEGTFGVSNSPGGVVNSATITWGPGVNLTSDLIISIEDSNSVQGANCGSAG